MSMAVKEGATPPLGTPRPWRADAGSLRLERAEVLRYLGYSGQELEAELIERIDAAIEEARRNLAPRGTGAFFGIEALGADDDGNPCIRLADTTVVLTGRDIYRHLKDAHAAAVFAVTLGMESERHLRVLSSQQPLDATLYDAACSALVEEAAEALDRKLKHDAAAYGLAGNWRFSCGYGDLPLDAQRSLLDALDARRSLGITLAPSNLMIPSKSITAVFGLFPTPNGEREAGMGILPAADAVRSCRGCRVAAGCSFRSRRTTCWN